MGRESIFCLCLPLNLNELLSWHCLKLVGSHTLQIVSSFSFSSITISWLSNPCFPCRMNEKLYCETLLCGICKGKLFAMATLANSCNNNPRAGFLHAHTHYSHICTHSLIVCLLLAVPTFVSFLKEVESPYEVHDYIRAYLGDTPEAKEFAKQFLERRAKQKASQQRQQQQVHLACHHLQEYIISVLCIYIKFQSEE